jgi:hypothetical protein
MAVSCTARMKPCPSQLFRSLFSPETRTAGGGPSLAKLTCSARRPSRILECTLIIARQVAVKTASFDLISAVKVLA